AAGTAAIPTLTTGVAFVDNASNNTVGGTTAAARNVISGNQVAGVFLGVYDTTTPAFNNLLEGNYIGTDPSGAMAIGNNGPGVLIADKSSGNLIGGTASGAGNLLSGNWASGIYITTTPPNLQRPTTVSPGPAFSNTIQGNYIGTNAAGTGALGNGSDGVLIDHGASGNTVGGTTPGDANVISGNGLPAGIVSWY